MERRLSWAQRNVLFLLAWRGARLVRMKGQAFREWAIEPIRKLVDRRTATVLEEEGLVYLSRDSRMRAEYRISPRGNVALVMGYYASASASSPSAPPVQASGRSPASTGSGAGAVGSGRPSSTRHRSTGGGASAR